MELEAFKTKIVPLRDKLKNAAFRLLQEKDDAEDVVQEVFLKLWGIRDDLDRYDSVEALAMQITKNKVLDRLKAKKTERLDESGNWLKSPILLPDRIIEEQDAVAVVRRIVDGLPLLQQTIIRMKDIEGYEIAEIAAITGTQVEAVRVNLSRARKKVRDLFMKINNGRYEN
ncbi:MAG: RNA polymerase sigma factor [Massilibacteroides sp.]|nr:RNA polymerase sigma factor [Massilibacteroides sp.]MDD3063580.1 RNA polymerase sigma factor [Massilibacteroides sp.]MDD4114253.1 RNA polymerase sigma factor [Massilibacteroides sp.]MDD4661005.1 RNA polymerase sigma factor [Massilibacteroides sp.]